MRPIPGSIRHLALTVTLVIIAGPAAAQSRAAVVHCSVSASPLVFGRYAPGSGVPNDSTATLTLACSSLALAPVPVRVTIALGAPPPVRKLHLGEHGLRYQLFTDAARTIPWGDGTGGTSPVVVTGTVSRTNPLHQFVIAYGRLLARQSNVSVGTYVDNVTTTVTY